MLQIKHYVSSSINVTCVKHANSNQDSTVFTSPTGSEMGLPFQHGVLILHKKV